MIELEVKNVGNYMIRVVLDNDAPCPAKDGELSFVFLWRKGKSWYLSENCNYEELFNGEKLHTIDEAVKELAMKYVDINCIVDWMKEGTFDFRMEYDEVNNLWLLKHNCWEYDDHEWYNYIEMEAERMYAGEYNEEILLSLPLEYVVDIINKSSEDIIVRDWHYNGSTQGNYIGGIAYMTKERYAEMVDRCTDDWKRKADELLQYEVNMIGMWAFGDVKGYRLYKKVPYTKQYEDPDRQPVRCYEWEEIDSCYGYYVTEDELIEHVMALHQIYEAA